MLERVRATIFVRHYEREGIKFTAGGIIVVVNYFVIQSKYVFESLKFESLKVLIHQIL